MLDVEREAQDNRKNCLNLIRLIAAMQVMCSHTLVHLQINIPAVCSHMVNFLRGVPVFFGLSGFLIWFSIGRTEKAPAYFKKRFLRIYPELWLAVCVEVFVMLILYRIRDIGELILFVFGQTTIFQFWTPDSLRTYGCGIPNGSLWTVTVIIQFYIIAWWLYKMLHKKTMKLWIGIWFALLVFCKIIEKLLHNFASTSISKLYDMTILPYLWIFMMGMFLAEFSKMLIPFLKKYWFVFPIIVLCINFIGYDFELGYGVLYGVSVMGCVFGFAYRFPKLEIKRDISYGLYLYHMTMVNAMIVLGFKGKLFYLVIVVAATCLLSFFSLKFANVVKKR